MTIKELINKLKEFDENKVVLVEDAEYGEFEAIEVKDYDDKYIIITSTISEN